MGEIIVDIELENVADRSLLEAGYRNEAQVRRSTAKAIVDTGAAMLVLPRDLVESLGVRELRTVTVSYANGERDERPVAGGLTVRIGDRFMITECIVGPCGTEPVVGQIVLGTLDLVADCAKQTLSPRPESRDRPLLNVL